MMIIALYTDDDDRQQDDDFIVHGCHPCTMQSLVDDYRIDHHLEADDYMVHG